MLLYCLLILSIASAQSVEMQLNGIVRKLQDDPQLKHGARNFAGYYTVRTILLAPSSLLIILMVLPQRW